MTAPTTQPTGRQRSGIEKYFIRRLTGLHSGLYRLTGGAIGSKMGRGQILLLITRGRTSGNEYTTPLIYLLDGRRMVLVASAGGSIKHPGWWLNLRAQGEAEVEVGKRRQRVRAHEAEGDERARLWQQMVAIYPTYADYQRATSRQIPVVVLEPIGG